MMELVKDLIRGKSSLSLTRSGADDHYFDVTLFLLSLTRYRLLIVRVDNAFLD